MAASRVRLDGVHVRYRAGPAVLTGVDLDLEPGLPVVVLGANGSGKSTLLRVAAGCMWPTRGTVTGRPRSVGYVPDRFPSQLRMPAGSYLRHMAALHRVDATDAVKQSTVLARELGFSDGLATAMSQLSKGNAQKIALAQALCSGARLLVLDEPWSGLDPAAAPVLTARIAAAAADGTTVLITDHSRTADGLPRRRLLTLAGGRLVAPDAGEVEQPAMAETVRVTLMHPQAEQLVKRLPAARLLDAAKDRATVDVEARRSDALLWAALDQGASIRSVRRMPAELPSRDGPDLDRGWRDP